MAHAIIGGDQAQMVTIQERVRDQAAKAGDLLERCHHHVSRMRGEAALENKAEAVPDFPGILYSLNEWDGALGSLARLESRLSELAGQLGSL